MSGIIQIFRVVSGIFEFSMRDCGIYQFFLRDGGVFVFFMRDCGIRNPPRPPSYREGAGENRGATHFYAHSVIIKYEEQGYQVVSPRS